MSGKNPFVGEDGVRMYLITTVSRDVYLMATDMALEPFIEKIESMDWFGGSPEQFFTTSARGWQRVLGPVAIKAEYIESVMMYPLKSAHAAGLVPQMEKDTSLDITDIEIPDSIPEWMDGGDDAPAT